MREPKNQMLGTMEPPLMQVSVNYAVIDKISLFQEIQIGPNFTYSQKS